MKRHFPKLLAASLAFIIGVISSGNAPYQIGRLHAYINVARGQHQLHIFGTINGDVEEFSEIAANYYGIEIVAHGCIISEQGIERIRGYNDVSLAAIKREYGTGVIDNIWERAQLRYRAKQPVH